MHSCTSQGRLPAGTICSIDADPIVWSSGGDSPQDPYSPYSPLPVLADDGAARRAVCGGYLRDKKEADGLRAPSRATARKAAHGAASIAQRCLPTSLSPFSSRRRTSARPPHSSRSRGAPPPASGAALVDGRWFDSAASGHNPYSPLARLAAFRPVIL